MLRGVYIINSKMMEILGEYIFYQFGIDQDYRWFREFIITYVRHIFECTANVSKSINV